MKKRIGFIARGLSNNGVKQFIVNVLKEWNKQVPDNVKIIVFTDEKEFTADYPNLEVIYIPNKNKLMWDLFTFPLEARKLNLDTVIYTKNVIPLTSLLFSWKKLIVVHDLGYLYPDLNAYKFWDTLYMKLMMGIGFRFADKIMAVSKFTKSEIIKFFKVPSSKIFVNYLGASDKYREIKDKRILNKIKEKYDLKLPFFFYVGSLSPRKNILRTLKAFNEVKNDIPHMFYLISSRSWNADQIYDYIEENLADRVRIIENVPEDDLVVIYNLAEALIYISLYEGFGLPIIEAYACNCNVITSNCSSCVEIGENKSIIINPRSIEEIKNSLKYLSAEEIKLKKINKNKKYQLIWRMTSEEILTNS